MTRQELTQQFYQQHRELINYITGLSEEDYHYRKPDKWTAEQQLLHIELCLQPLAQALSSKEYLAQKFGTIDRERMDYDKVRSVYVERLSSGGKAPERFVPSDTAVNDKILLANSVDTLAQTICKQLESYSDEELNTLVLPHPLLGMITVREMFYLMTYHATHHQKQVEQNLQR